MTAEFVGVMTEEHMVADPEKAENDSEIEDDEKVETDEVKPWIY
jgi:hypothetical protein